MRKELKSTIYSFILAIIATLIELLNEMTYIVNIDQLFTLIIDTISWIVFFICLIRLAISKVKEKNKKVLLSFFYFVDIIAIITSLLGIIKSKHTKEILFQDMDTLMYTFFLFISCLFLLVLFIIHNKLNKK